MMMRLFRSSIRLNWNTDRSFQIYFRHFRNVLERYRSEFIWKVFDSFFDGIFASSWRIFLLHFMIWIIVKNYNTYILEIYEDVWDVFITTGKKYLITYWCTRIPSVSDMRIRCYSELSVNNSIRYQAYLYWIHLTENDIFDEWIISDDWI